MKNLFTKLVFLILISMTTLCFADDVAILSEDLTLTLPNIEYQGAKINYKAVLKHNSSGTWYIYSLEPIKPSQDVDAYGSGEASILAEINKYRANGAPCANGGLPPVSYNQQLTTAALNHSIDMAANNYFDHYGLDGSSPWDRIAKAGFTGTPTGENIAAGYDMASVVTGWINSPGHCSAIMSSASNVIGFGWASKSTSDWNTYYTMTFGRK